MPEIRKYQITEPYLALDCSLGEAPFWEQDHGSLRLVDIVKKKLHRIDFSNGPSYSHFDLEHSISTTAEIEGNDSEFIFGGKLGYGIMDRSTGKCRWVSEVWTDAERQDDGGGKPGVGKNKEERMRSNDGAVDSHGRYWLGTMSVNMYWKRLVLTILTDDDALVGENFTDEGVLFRLDRDMSLHRIMEGITIPNGISWSLDDKTMYFTDSPSGTITAYPYNPETGDISIDEGKPFFKVDQGVPDGHCQDEEGCLWVANHGAGKVWRVSPQGETIAQIDLPTRCVTCPTFVGTELFITSMKEVDPEKYPESTKYQGALFKIDVGVRGKVLNKFKLLSMQS